MKDQVQLYYSFSGTKCFGIFLLKTSKNPFTYMLRPKWVMRYFHDPNPNPTKLTWVLKKLRGAH